MKRVIQYIFVLSFGLLLVSAPSLYAQEVVNDEVCVVDEQEVLIDEQIDQVICEEEPEVTELEPLIKGAKNPETVAGTPEELANQPAVLGESTEILAETGAGSTIAFFAGISIIITTIAIFKTSKTNTTKKW